MSGSVGTATPATRAQAAGGGTALVMPGRGAGGRAYHLLHIIFLKSEREKSNQLPFLGTGFPAPGLGGVLGRACRWRSRSCR